MKAIIGRAYGVPEEVLRLVDIDEPQIAPDDVLVRVHAASVNPADWHLVRGTPFVVRTQFGVRTPKFRIPGCDVAGTVHAVGRNVTSLRPGAEVFGTSFMRGFGTFAEFVSVPASLVARKPTNLTFEQAAAVPLGNEGAEQFVHVATGARGE